MYIQTYNIRGADCSYIPAINNLSVGRSWRDYCWHYSLFSRWAFSTQKRSVLMPSWASLQVFSN